MAALTNVLAGPAIDGKAMLNSNFREGERCWLCDAPVDLWADILTPVDFVLQGPRYGAYHKEHCLRFFLDADKTPKIIKEHEGAIMTDCECGYQCPENTVVYTYAWEFCYLRLCKVIPMLLCCFFWKNRRKCVSAAAQMQFFR